MGVCNCSMFCCMLLYVHSSFAIILMGMRELVALLNLRDECVALHCGAIGLSAVCDCVIFLIILTIFNHKWILISLCRLETPNSGLLQTALVLFALTIS